MRSVAENTDKAKKSAVKRAGLMTACCLVASCLGGAAHAGQIKTVFVIAVQPASQTSPGQLFGNTAAPYINSLVTPGNPNAAQTSYASNYLNAGLNIHPSEPNYIWAEAGSNLGISPDAKGNAYTNNILYTHSSDLLTMQEIFTSANAYGTLATPMTCPTCSWPARFRPRSRCPWCC